MSRLGRDGDRRARARIPLELRRAGGDLQRRTRGYFTPFTLDEAAFRFLSTTFDDDLDASRVAVVDGEPAGICKLAIRGDRGWIAGVGAPSRIAARASARR